MSLSIGIYGLGKVGTLVMQTIEKYSNLQSIALPKSFDIIHDQIPQCDVIIDFSTPDATITILDLCYKLSIPLVIGTTGLTETHYTKIREISQKIPIFHSSNMAISLFLVKNIIKELNDNLQKLGNYDVEIVERHHKHKKDAPSGTAIMLAQGMNYPWVYGREGKKQPGEIGISSIRAGETIGEHTIILANEIDEIEITHRVHDRAIFAQGAINAAIWLVKQTPGVYTMQEFLSVG